MASLIAQSCLLPAGFPLRPRRTFATRVGTVGGFERGVRRRCQLKLGHAFILCCGGSKVSSDRAIYEEFTGRRCPSILFGLEKCSGKALLSNKGQLAGEGNKLSAVASAKGREKKVSAERGSGENGVSDLTSALGAKVCHECKHTKLAVDFERVRNKSGLRTDNCRACLAAMRAKRLGHEVEHLKLTVDEAWGRAKTCTMCERVKEARDFAVQASASDGLFSYCRACNSVRRVVANNPPSDKPQKCRHCGEVRPADEFYADRSRVNGLWPVCKPCQAEVDREAHKRRMAAGDAVRVETKRCMRCLQRKAVAEFSKWAPALDGLRTYCKKCNSEYRSQWKPKGRTE